MTLSLFQAFCLSCAAYCYWQTVCSTRSDQATSSHVWCFDTRFTDDH